MSTTEPLTVKGRRTRERIVSAAAELVAEKGASAVSLDDIGELASASRSQLYHYFEDRDDLIRAVVNATSTTVLGAQRELFDGLDSWEGIETWMDALVALQVARDAHGGCPLGSLSGQLAETDPAARAALATGMDAWESEIAEGLHRMRDSGALLAHADPDALAKATLSLLQGGLLMTQIRRNPQELRASLDAALQLLRMYAQPEHSRQRRTPTSSRSVTYGGEGDNE